VPRTSAALCLWRPIIDDSEIDAGFEVLLVHPGGPFWANKDLGAWSLPKGEFDPEVEDGLVTAQREFAEETGSAAPDSDYVSLGETRLKSGKIVRAWAVQGDLDAEAIASNSFEMQWPPKSGIMMSFPEVDRAQWCGPELAAQKLNAAQVIFVERLADELRA